MNTRCRATVTCISNPQQIDPELRDEIAAELYETIERNREHLKNLEWSSGATLESTKIYIDSLAHSRNISRVIHVNGKACGMVILRPKKEGYWEVGYWLDKQWTGRHVMTDLLGNIMYIARAIYGVVEPFRARIRRSNIASQNVVKANGFRVIDEDVEWLFFEQVNSEDLYS